MAVTLRGFYTESSEDLGAGAVTSLTMAFVPWSGSNPQPGDLAVITGYIGAAGQTVTQTGGTGTWTILSGDSNSGGAGFTSFVAYRALLGTDTPPVFSWGSTADWAYLACSFIPSAGYTLVFDASSAVLVAASPGTSFIPNAVTSAGSGELSLILNAAQATASQYGSILLGPSAGWTLIGQGGGGQPAVPDSASGSWQAGAGGTITPAAQNLVIGGTGTVCANIYHLLFKEVLSTSVRSWGGQATFHATEPYMAVSYPGPAPQSGDLLVIAAILSVPNLAVYQIGGAGPWVILSSATNSGGSYTSFTAYRVYDAADTEPMFRWTGSAAECSYIICALTPAPGKSLTADVSSLHEFTSAANSFTPDALTASAGDLSLILNAAKATATGSHQVTQTPPSGWTAIGETDTNGGVGWTDYYAGISWQSGMSGTVTPGPESLASSATVWADVLHLLIREAAEGFPAYAENVDPQEPMPGWFPGAPGMPIGVPFQTWPEATEKTAWSGPPLAGPAYGSAAADIGGGTGAWVNPANADGGPDGAYATWTVP